MYLLTTQIYESETKCAQKSYHSKVAIREKKLMCSRCVEVGGGKNVRFDG